MLPLVEFLAKEAGLVKDFIYSVKYVVVKFLHNVYRRCCDIKIDSSSQLRENVTGLILTEEKICNINSFMQLNSSFALICRVAFMAARHERGEKWR